MSGTVRKSFSDCRFGTTITRPRHHDELAAVTHRSPSRAAGRGLGTPPRPNARLRQEGEHEAPSQGDRRPPPAALQPGGTRRRGDRTRQVPTPWTNWTWYASEYDPVERLCFGVVLGHERELGYFSIDELEAIRGPGGLTIERDLYWKAKPLKECQ